jgi:beta-glucosidase
MTTNSLVQPSRVRRLLTARRLAVLAVIALVSSAWTLVDLPAAQAADTLLSQGKPAAASSTESAGTSAAAAVDGVATTRWASAHSDPQWLQVDLGTVHALSSVTLNWEAAYAKTFTIQLSSDAVSWTDISLVTNGVVGAQSVTVSGTGRYVRMNGITRATGYGYSLWEFQVYGGPTISAPSCDTTNVALNRPASASSVQNSTTPASAAFDGRPTTRWSSAFSDPQWIQVDLSGTGGNGVLCRIVLNWEAAYAKTFTVQGSQLGADGPWLTLLQTTTGHIGVQSLDIPLNRGVRFVRLNGLTRATSYGYSLWEFEIYTDNTVIPPPAPA